MTSNEECSSKIGDSMTYYSRTEHLSNRLKPQNWWEVAKPIKLLWVCAISSCYHIVIMCNTNNSSHQCKKKLCNWEFPFCMHLLCLSVIKEQQMFKQTQTVLLDYYWTTKQCGTFYLWDFENDYRNFFLSLEKYEMSFMNA